MVFPPFRVQTKLPQRPNERCAQRPEGEQREPPVRCSGKFDATTTHSFETTASSRDHCERRLVTDNADVPLAGGCVFHSQHVTRSEVPSLTIGRGY